MIKVGSGKYRSRNLLTPKEGTLPTKSMVRDAMLNAVSTAIPGGRVLDLFAGSGALGIEALSRGASYCVFVDASLDAANTVQKNLETLKETNARVIRSDYRSALSSLAKEQFDIVFLDPPYAMKESYGEVLGVLLREKMLKTRAYVVLEYEGEIDIDGGAFASRRDYRYGKTKVIILEANA